MVFPSNSFSPAKPEWITRPRKTVAGSNTTVVLPCVAFGIPSVKYTWYFNGRPMIWTERHMFKEGNLTIKGLTTADNGIYQCFVKNKHGEMHADMELSVSGKTLVLKTCRTHIEGRPTESRKIVK